MCLKIWHAWICGHFIQENDDWPVDLAVYCFETNPSARDGYGTKTMRKRNGFSNLIPSRLNWRDKRWPLAHTSFSGDGGFCWNIWPSRHQGEILGWMMWSCKGGHADLISLLPACFSNRFRRLCDFNSIYNMIKSMHAFFLFALEFSYPNIPGRIPSYR